MDIIEVTNWLKTTIPGIIILGAIGSILGTFLLWFAYKFFKWILELSKSFILTLFGKPLSAFGIIYLRQYFVFRSIFSQLSSKQKYSSLTLLHQKITSEKSSSGVAFLVLFIVTYMFFLFTGTEHLKTAVGLVALAFGFFHDFIMYSVFQSKIETLSFGTEKAIAENSYACKDNVKLEMVYSISLFLKGSTEKANKAIKSDS